MEGKVWKRLREGALAYINKLSHSGVDWNKRAAVVGREADHPRHSHRLLMNTHHAPKIELARGLAVVSNKHNDSVVVEAE